MDIVDELEARKGTVYGGAYNAMRDAAREIKRQRKAMNELAKYFTSGNSVPVERATIMANDFWRITGLEPSSA